MKNFDAAKQILGMRITKDREVFKPLQEEYVRKVLSRFNMVGAKPVSTLWLVTSIYPKINHPQLN